MTVKECYDEMGGNYDSVVGRLRSDERIVRFLSRVPTDPCITELETSMASGDAPTAFRASHTLKGICLNLSLDKLAVSANALTDELRGKDAISDEAKKLYEEVKANFAVVAAAISKL